MSIEKGGRLTALRIILILHASGILAQSVLAGQFLAGSDGAVAYHESTGWAIVTVCLLQIVAAAMLKGAPLWLVISSVGVFLGEALQIGTGYGRFLNVHIPLSLLLAAGVMGQVAWSFVVSPAAERPSA
jgi:hypothetical protein